LKYETAQSDKVEKWAPINKRQKRARNCLYTHL
jgi:hypothetical protein